MLEGSSGTPPQQAKMTTKEGKGLKKKSKKEPLSLLEAFEAEKKQAKTPKKTKKEVSFNPISLVWKAWSSLLVEEMKSACNRFSSNFIMHKVRT